jgi:hypothetical protein
MNSTHMIVEQDSRMQSNQHCRCHGNHHSTLNLSIKTQPSHKLKLLMTSCLCCDRTGVLGVYVIYVQRNGTVATSVPHLYLSRR